jgi:hypothetical protein
MFNSPVPEFNSGLGYCYFPDDAHYRTLDLQSWLPELKALGASWITLLGSATRAIPETFVRGMLDADIEPIIQIPIPVSQPVDMAVLETLLSSYAHWGVRYIVVFDKPNTKANWNSGDWSQPDLVGRFVEMLLPVLQLEDRLGLVPVFPALQQGGDYWDTSFLDIALNHIKGSRAAAVLDRLVFAHYAFAYNRPPNWGAGGQTRWSQTQPYNAPPNSQDQRGFRSFEWYAEVISSRLGHPRPLLMVAGGAKLGDSTDPNFPAVDETWHATCNTEIMQAMSNRQLPDYLLNTAFYLICAPAGSDLEAVAWYHSDGSALSVVGAIKQQVSEAVQALADAEKVVAPKPAVKHGQASGSNQWPLYHYVLLPTFEWGVSSWHWGAVLEYVNRFRPACGFSIAEAAAAQYVTIVGNKQGVDSAAEQSLRDAGCVVERVCGQDGDETMQRLNELARAGRRFQTAP